MISNIEVLMARCPTCRGKGTIVLTRGLWRWARGDVLALPCRDCHGHGRVTAYMRARIQLRDGQRHA